MHEKDARHIENVRPDTGDSARRRGDDDARGLQPVLPGDGWSALRPGVARLDSVVSTSRLPEPDSAVLRSGGKRSSGAGSTDGGAIRSIGGSECDRGPRFDLAVSPGGYVWWYVDAISDDDKHAITLIAFLGSVFSPYYAWSRWRGANDPLNHSAVNVVLYGERSQRWTMTERGRQSVARTEKTLSIGPSVVEWDGTALVFHIDEIAVPIPRRVRGMVRVFPPAIGDVEIVLDADGRHHWRPIAPVGRVEVDLDRPSLRWSGNAYFDTNAGEEPLENAFNSWHWSRATSNNGTTILYDVIGRKGDERSVALQFDIAGGAFEIDQPPPIADLAKTFWRVNRSTRTDSGTKASVIKTLEDAPFYARSLVSGTLLGQQVQAVHESLSLDRFRTLMVKAMLPFRMPRTTR